jgi:hypothetical protein
LGLVAYDEPYEDPRSKDLVSHEARLELADEVNKAILGTFTCYSVIDSLTSYSHNRQDYYAVYRTAISAYGDDDRSIRSN